MKRTASAGLGVVVGLVLLWVAFRGVPVGEVIDSLKDYEWPWTPVLVGLPVLDLWLRAVRWRILLKPVAEAPTAKLLQLEAVGLGLNNLLFMRLGELARALVGGLELEAHAFAVLATIVVERLCDSGALMGLFAVDSWLFGAGVRSKLELAAAAAAVAVAAALGAAVAAEEWLARQAREGPLARWPTLSRLAEDMAAGTRGLRAPGAWWKVAGLSLALWACDAGFFWSAGRALALDPPLDYGGAVVVITSAAAATALPAMPGGFGNFEAAVKWALHRRGVDAGDALAYAAFVHLVMYAVVTTLGIVFLYRLGHTLEGLKKAVEDLRHHRRPGADPGRA